MDALPTTSSTAPFTLDTSLWDAVAVEVTILPPMASSVMSVNSESVAGKWTDLKLWSFRSRLR